jgi:hypothetical protein
MKIDSFIQLINNIRKGQIDGDDDGSNTVVQLYTNPLDTASASESVRIFKFNSAQAVWGDGKVYTAYDQQGVKFNAPSCGWLYGAGGRWN